MSVQSYKKIYTCNDSLEGVFSAIYEAYQRKSDPFSTSIQIKENLELSLFMDYVDIEESSDYTKKVCRTIQTKFGSEAYMDICRALSTSAPDKADAVYHGMEEGFKMKEPRQFMGNLGNPWINRIFQLSRQAGNEAHHLLGFLRFSELENGVLFSRIGPKNNILSFLAPHFADRLPNENFLIFDDKRNLFVVHPANRPWVIVEGEEVDLSELEGVSENEVYYRELFQCFFTAIGIEERKNLRLQKQMLPLRFQKYMTEFQNYSNCL